MYYCIIVVFCCCIIEICWSLLVRFPNSFHKRNMTRSLPLPGNVFDLPANIVEVTPSLVEDFDVDGVVESDGDDVDVVVAHGEVDVIMLKTSSSSLRVSWSNKFLFENTFSSSSKSSSQYTNSSPFGSFTISALLFRKSRFPFRSLNLSQKSSDLSFTELKLRLSWGINQVGIRMKIMIIVDERRIRRKRKFDAIAIGPLDFFAYLAFLKRFCSFRNVTSSFSFNLDDDKIEEECAKTLWCQ